MSLHWSRLLIGCAVLGTAACRPVDRPETLAIAAAMAFQPAVAPRLQVNLSALLLDDRVLATTDPHFASGGARPFNIALDSTPSSRRALECLTAAVYHEARSEGEEGQRAVAQVVLNRVRHFAYPSTVCGVVFQGPLKAGGGCQFSFTCDGSLRRPREAYAWSQAERIATEALSGAVYVPVGWATHYHTTAVQPSWSRQMHNVALIGAHRFFRWHGSAGAPASFVRLRSSQERVIAAPAPQSGGCSLSPCRPVEPSPSASEV